MEIIDVVFADLHIGLPNSRWDAVLTTLQKITSLDETTLGAIIFAGDTVDITRADSRLITKDFVQFCRALKQLNLLHRTVFLHGNHDPTINHLLEVPDCIIRSAVLLRYSDTSLLIVHGNDIGLEAAVSHHGLNAEAFATVKRRLIHNPPSWLPNILGPNDWFIAGHFTLPHINHHMRTAGLSSWTDNLTDHWRGHYLIIRPHHTRPPLTLNKYGKPIPY